MHKPESYIENETHNFPWDFVIQTNPLMPVRRPDQVMINQKLPCRILSEKKKQQKIKQKKKRKES